MNSPFDALLERRVAALSPDARALALGLALARDESRSSWQPEVHVRFEDYPLLLDNGGGARTSAALDNAREHAVRLAIDATGVLVLAAEQCRRGHFWVVIAHRHHVLFRYTKKWLRRLACA